MVLRKDRRSAISFFKPSVPWLTSLDFHLFVPFSFFLRLCLLHFPFSSGPLPMAMSSPLNCRLGIGVKSEEAQARVTHFAPFDPAAVQTSKHKDLKPALTKRELERRDNKDKQLTRHLRSYFNS